MTESVQGMSQSQETGSSQPVTPSSSAPSTQSAPVSDERTFRQSEVNDIVKKAKYGAVEDFKRMQTTQPSYIQEKHSSFTPPTERPSEYQLPEDRIRQIVNDATKQQLESMRAEAYQHSQTEAAKKTVQNFWNKVTSGREKFQDFDTVVGDINFQGFPNVVEMLGDHIENADQVLYELGKDRTKMANLEYLAERSPQDALKAAQRLAKSLQDNEAAGKVRLPNEPLSQMRPSNAGTDTGAMSVTDYRKKYKV
jgi:hypothetical protein